MAAKSAALQSGSPLDSGKVCNTSFCAKFKFLTSLVDSLKQIPDLQQPQHPQQNPQPHVVEPPASLFKANPVARQKAVARPRSTFLIFSCLSARSKRCSCILCERQSSSFSSHENCCEQSCWRRSVYPVSSFVGSLFSTTLKGSYKRNSKERSFNLQQPVFE